MESYVVAVVGLGVLGSDAAYYAARKGARVIAFEQFELGHVRGASHDTSRIVRTSNATPEYVALAKSAYKDWAELEEVSGRQLLTTTGGLVFFPQDSPTPALAKDFINSLNQESVPYELLSAKQVNERWPQFNVPDNVDVVYTADSGIAHAPRTVNTLQFLAQKYGALLKEHTKVQRITTNVSMGVIITTSNSHVQIQAAKVILATDAWTNELLMPLGVHIPLSVMQEQVTYFKPNEPERFELRRFPVWIWHGENCFYGFPCYGEPTVKAARDLSHNFMSPEERTYTHSPQLLNQLSSFLEDFIPDTGRQPLRTITCQYSITPNRHFIISPLKDHPEIIVGLGAAHAFKFAPAFGRVLAELAVDGRTAEDISKWGIPRSAACSSKW